MADLRQEESAGRSFEGVSDPVTVSVVFHRLLTINKEMGITMTRTSRSPIFAEVHDFSCAICDWVPRIVAQIDGVPSHTASSMIAAKAVRDRFGGDIHPGDVFIINDAYSGGTHLADVTIIKPVFYHDELLFMAINRAHHLDVGGLTPGSYSPLATEIFQEGIRIPPLRIYHDGKPIMDVIETLCLNTRMPDLFWSDIKAQVASCSVAEKRLTELTDKYGPPRLKVILEDIQRYAAKRMRQEIKKIPDGVYDGTAYLDGDGFSATQVKVQVQFEIKGEEMFVNFDGADPQTKGFINSPFANSATSVYVSVLTTVSQDVPHNEGAYQPIHITARLGSLVNPLPPAPVASSTLDTACAILEACFMALSKAMPNRVPAGWSRWCGPSISGIDPRSGEFYVQYAFCGMGGGGALPFMDGFAYIGDGIDLGGLTAPNIESNELEYPHITAFHEFLPDSGGAGKYRGGAGVRYRIQFLGKEAPTFVMFGDGKVNPPYGLFGGRPGSLNRPMLNDGSPDERELPAKGIVELKPGDFYSVYSSGGGGWGNPLERDPVKVREDVLNGLVSLESAQNDYGVVFQACPQAERLDNLELDIAATSDLRTAALKGAER
ncbi:MAG: hydantoinase B/oxoprolinase family protein [Coprothermobacterota bacterium]|nr:hydantoinase B/oxoprolinase family protein [Coprothermobacterota bacterium]